ncbi:hypothetical protein PVK06_024088 [Gossypium arboreum]|uniref:Retrotransposon gag domain-containing protein n=1 Tax=Gossypium arboreum TaxID=29729 RepID=A0ABR0PCW4_GOSAR|nr:hypothetical protein PVK06_024088 [Gossypium arboreum]
MRISPPISHQARPENHVTPLRDEAVGAHAKSWQNEMYALHKDVTELHFDVQVIDWLFCSNDPLSPKMATMSLPTEFKVPKETFKGRRDLQAHLMQYNDYMNVLGASNVTKCKSFSITLRGSANDCYLSLPQGSIQSFSQLGHMLLEDFEPIGQ